MVPVFCSIQNVSFECRNNRMAHTVWVQLWKNWRLPHYIAKRTQYTIFLSGWVERWKRLSYIQRDRKPKMATFGIKWDKKGLTCDGNVYKCTICEVHMSYARRNSTIRMALSKVTQLKKMNDSSLGSSWSLAFNSSSTMTWELAWTAQVFLYV